MNISHELWQACHNELLVIREHIDRVSAIVTRLNPRPSGTTIQTECAEVIQKFICAKYDIRYQSLIGKSRANRFVQPRWLAIWLIRKYCPELTLNAVASMFGGRDHGSVIHAVNTLEERAQAYPVERRHLDSIDTECRTYLERRQLLPASEPSAPPRLRGETIINRKS